MSAINNLDDYRHKLVDKILLADSCEQIKRLVLTAIHSLNKHKIHSHLVNRFIDKTINQLHGISLTGTDIRRELNLKYAKSQLELIKKHHEEQKATNV